MVQIVSIDTTMAEDADDVVFLVGPPGKAKRIRVSATVLSHASKVFSAMLSPGFLEGSPSMFGSKQISLPDDDPEATTWICDVLHFRENVSHDVSFRLMEKIAILCDKYNLEVALQAWSELCLQKWQKRVVEEQQCKTLMNMAAIFGSQDTFWTFSLKLLWTYPIKKKLSRNQPNPLLPSLPNALFGRPSSRPHQLSPSITPWLTKCIRVHRFTTRANVTKHAASR